MERKRPRFPEPYWLESTELPHREPLTQDIKVDVCIIGGGITGITTGYLLTKEGLKTAILEAGTVLNGTTGHTTAKLTTQHGLIYDEFIQHFGEEKAKLYYQANDQALNFIEQHIKKEQIDCDFEKQHAYIYANSEKGMQKIDKEIQAYKRLGLRGGAVDALPFDLQMKAAIQMRDQAQFHPAKYIKHLLHAFLNEGGLFFEKTTAVDIDTDTPAKVVTSNGHKVTSDYVISASHFPFYDHLTFYFTRMHTNRSYILAIKAKKDFPSGMYLSADKPERSLRDIVDNGEKLILVAGESHKTGQGINTMEHYKALEDFAETVLGIDEYRFRWSAQDLITLDKVPYIGQISDDLPNVLVATGFRKWGMTNSTSAALLFRDYILKKESPYLELYSPSRLNVDPSLRHFLKENLNVAAELVKGKFDMTFKRANDIEIGEGAIIRVNGARAGAYRDESNQLHVVDTTCQHLGCEVEWNAGDRTWDCPCHGSRYSIEGNVVEGPSQEPLKRYKL